MGNTADEGALIELILLEAEGWRHATATVLRGLLSPESFTSEGSTCLSSVKICDPSTPFCRILGISAAVEDKAMKAEENNEGKYRYCFYIPFRL